MALFNDKKVKETEETKTKEVKEVKETAPKSMQDLYAGEVKKAVKSDKKVAGQAYRLLIKPLVTEKAANLSALNKYVFMVAPDANKISVAAAVQEVYGIKPVDVNIIKMKGKRVLRGRISGQRKDWKKAIVTLPAGKTIKVYEGV